MSATIKLICPECQHENEPERIYCHSCGTRLDRSAVSSRVTQKETVTETRKRVRKMFDPTALKIRLMIFRIVRLVAGACLLAAVIQMLLPPELPAQPETAELGLSQINFDLENVLTRHTQTPLQYTEDQVNNHLSNALRTKKAKLNKPFLDFVRAIVQLHEGSCDFTVERSVFGLSLYSSISYAVRVGDGKPVVTTRGGGIGRMPVHPMAMDFIDIIFSDVWSSLDREYKLVSKMGGIEFHDKTVVLTPPVVVQ